MSKIKYGVIGLGWFGGKHLEALSSIDLSFRHDLGRVRADFPELARTGGQRALFGGQQIDSASLADRRETLLRTVPQVDFEAHQSQMRGHCSTAVAGSHHTERGF